MTADDKKILAQKIEQDFEKFCDKYDEWWTKCPYGQNGVHCEIEYTLSYLNKRKQIK